MKPGSSGPCRHLRVEVEVVDVVEVEEVDLGGEVVANEVEVVMPDQWFERMLQTRSDKLAGRRTRINGVAGRNYKEPSKRYKVHLSSNWQLVDQRKGTREC